MTSKDVKVKRGHDTMTKSLAKSKSESEIQKEKSRSTCEVERDSGVDQSSSGVSSSASSRKPSDCSNVPSVEYQLSTIQSAVEKILDPRKAEFSNRIERLCKDIGNTIAKCAETSWGYVVNAEDSGRCTLVVGPLDTLSENHAEGLQVSFSQFWSSVNNTSPDLNARRSVSGANSSASQESVSTCGSSKLMSATSRDSQFGGDAVEMNLRQLHAQCEV